MDIELQQHKDGTYVLMVRYAKGHKEIDVTNVLRDVFLDKIHDLQQRITTEQKYRNWVLGSAKETSSKLINAYARYRLVSQRLNQTNEAIKEVITTWRDKKDLLDVITKISRLVAQNDYFLKNDSTLIEIEKLKEE
jgi:hypothetical protein